MKNKTISMKHFKLFQNYINENIDDAKSIDTKSVENDIYNDIDMMMRPGDDTLSYDEIKVK